MKRNLPSVLTCPCCGGEKLLRHSSLCGPCHEASLRGGVRQGVLVQAAASFLPPLDRPTLARLLEVAHGLALVPLLLLAADGLGGLGAWEVVRVRGNGISSWLLALLVWIVLAWVSAWALLAAGARYYLRRRPRVVLGMLGGLLLLPLGVVKAVKWLRQRKSL
ncbi:MAG TPA: hypothetical protein EYP85_16135 [Armatimonadetes bacterium]|nr:hypothetical protein [Armatimonadota bacterium]